MVGEGDTGYQKAQGAVNDQRLRVSQLKTMLEEMQNLKPEALKEALKQFQIDDPAVANNLSQLQAARVDESNLLNSGLGENHPRIRALAGQDVYPHADPE